MSNYAYINGTMMPATKAVIPINDLGLLRGYAVFDYLRTYNGKPFLMANHLERFENSAKALRLKIPISKKEISNTIHSLLEKSKIKKDVGIRLLITGGNALDGISLPSNPNFIIAIENLTEPSKEEYAKGIKLITYKFQREIPWVKTTNYQNAIRNNDTKLKQNAYDILCHFNNHILETTRNNFFVFKGNTLVTAKENILHGVTRKLVLELAKEDFDVEERVLKIDELKEVTEAFVTGTTKKLIPVVQIDTKKVGNGKVGQNTKLLLNKFENFLKVF